MSALYVMAGFLEGGWRDSWVDGRMGGWTDGWMDGGMMDGMNE